jgi:hypothetical protein
MSSEEKAKRSLGQPAFTANAAVMTQGPPGHTHTALGRLSTFQKA